MFGGEAIRPLPWLALNDWLRSLRPRLAAIAKAAPPRAAPAMYRNPSERRCDWLTLTGCRGGMNCYDCRCEWP